MRSLHTNGGVKYDIDEAIDKLTTALKSKTHKERQDLTNEAEAYLAPRIRQVLHIASEN